MSALALLALLSCADEPPATATRAAPSAGADARTQPAASAPQLRPAAGDRFARASRSAAPLPGDHPADRARAGLQAIPGLSAAARSAMALHQWLPLSEQGRSARGGPDTLPAVARFRAEVQGRRVLESEVRLLLDADGRLVAGSWSEAVEAGLDAASKAATWQVDEDEAVALSRDTVLGPDAWVQRARVEEVWIQGGTGLIPALRVELWAAPSDQQDSRLWEVVVRADDGDTWRVRELTVHAEHDYTAWVDEDLRPLDSPLEDTTPHATGVPDEVAYPGWTEPSTVTVDGLNENPDGVPDPWLPEGATESTGNNADVYTDWYSPDGFSDGDRRAPVVDGGLVSVYDGTLSPTADTDQVDAAIAQAFYTVNWLHDWYYDLGFTEALGNAQTDNYDRGGEEADALLIEVQDNAFGGSRNNANMSTPGDGSAPRMQVYLWSARSELSLTVDPGDRELSTNTASFGPTGFDVTGPLALPGSDDSACTGVDADVTDAVVLIERGGCYFVDKVRAAQDAGAAGVIIANNTTGGAMSMGGSAGDITTPVLSVSQADGDDLYDLVLTGDTGGEAPSATLYRDSGVEADGSLDATVVAHEWGHYLYGRLLGCGTTQCSGINEGHADFVALAMMVREGDDLYGAYPVGTYATGGYATDPVYYGIRRAPYSADPAINALSFRHVSDGEPLPDSHPLDDSGVNNAQVHNAGEIWASTMHDAQVALLDAAEEDGRTFAEAQERIGRILVAGLALAPNDPTYTELRDAMLAAAAVLDEDGPRDATRVATAFAGRGMGTCAESPPRTSVDLVGVVEDDSLSPMLDLAVPALVDDAVSCDDDGILDGGEVGSVSVTLTNMGAAVLSGTTLTASFEEALPDVAFREGDTVTVPDLEPFTSTTVQIPVAMPREATTPGATTLTVTAVNDSACVTEEVQLTWTRSETDVQSAASSTETFEADDGSWTVEGDEAGEIWRLEQGEAGDRSWVGEDVSGVTDSRLVSPELRVSSDEALVFTLTHRYSFEHDGATPWDGGVIELSVDGGEWTDVSEWVDPGYTDVLTTIADNPLGDRWAFSGRNSAWPEYEDLVLDLGDALAGRTVRFSLRVGTDQAASDYGWELDTLAVDGLAADPFPAVVADTTDCNPLPVADAGPDQVVEPGDAVQLDGTASYDPADEPLAFAWTVLSGEGVTLDGADGDQPTFVAPDVTDDLTVEVQLTVDDGLDSDSDTVVITVDAPEVEDTGPADDGGSDSGGAGDAGGGTDGDLDGDDGDDGEAPKGGCSAAPAAAGALWLVGLAGVARRRR